MVLFPSSTGRVPVDRRAALRLAAGAAFAATLAGPLGRATAASLFDPTKRADARLMYRKLQYRSDSGLVFWWLQGPKYGVVGAAMTPLYTMNVGTIQRIRQRADGGFDMTSLEIVFLTDLNTGQRLTEFRNPYTGEVLPVRFAPVGPTTITYGSDNDRDLPKELGGARLESTASTAPPLVVGDDVFIRNESKARVFTPNRTTPYEVNDISVLHGSLKNLSDPEVTMADAKVFFAEVTSWQRWLNMGDRPGGLTSRSVGAKVRSFAAMPAPWRRMLADAAPDIAADPAAALDRPPTRFDR